MALIGAALTLAAWLFLHESHPSHARQPLQARALLANYRLVAGQRNSACSPWRWRAISAGFFCTSLRPVFLMRHLGLNEQQFIYLFGPAVCGIMLGAFLSGRLAGRRSPREIVSLGYSLMAIAAVSNLLYNLWLPPALPWSVLPLACYTVGMSLVAPTVTPLPDGLLPQPARRHLLTAGFTQTLFSSLVAGVISPCCGIPLPPWRWACAGFWRAGMGCCGGCAGRV